MAAEPKPAQLRLEFEDLHRLEETFKPLFRRALSVGRVDFLPAPAAGADTAEPLGRAAAKGRAVFDERGARLVVPLVDGGRALGLLVAYGVSAEQLHPAVNGFLAALVEAALEMARLKLLAETDRLTGLATEEAFDQALTGAVSRLKPSPTRGRPALERAQAEGGVFLLALKPLGMEGLRERYGRRFGDLVLAELARRLKELLPGALSLARSGEGFLALAAGGAAEAREAGGRLKPALEGLDLLAPDKSLLRPAICLGAAVLDGAGWRGSGEGMASEAAAGLKARAQRALERAPGQAPAGLLFFHEIKERAGRLKQILPMDRVVLDLGRVHGVGEGDRFSVVAEEGGQPAKAEILVVSVAEEEAVAEVSALLDPTWCLRIGDRLRLLGQESAQAGDAPEQEVLVADRKVRVVLDALTGLYSHRSLVALFSALCAGQEGFAAALLRLEGLEGMREVCGLVGTEALVKNLAAAAREGFPAEALIGRYAPDTVGVLLPGREPEAVRPLCEAVMARVAAETSRPLRAGLAGHPRAGFAAADALDNAAKALVHAGFLEPGSAVAFDAVSLNVSGDALYAQGRISEAVVEYERALIIKPDEVNVLNSLGVCYGLLGQMDKALALFERALTAAPQDFMAHYNLGYSLMAQGKVAEARGHLERSLALKPDHADTLFQLGRLAQSEGRLPEALEFFGQAVRQANCPRGVHRSLGEALAAAGRFPEAEEAFNQAVKKRPNDAGALSSLAGLYLDRGANLEIALSLARRARDLEPQAARHVRVMARALLALGRLAEAEALLRQAAAEFPSEPFLAVQLGQTLAARGLRDAARDEFTRALSLEPHLEAARQGLAELEPAAS